MDISDTCYRMVYSGPVDIDMVRSYYLDHNCPIDECRCGGQIVSLRNGSGSPVFDNMVALAAV
jgi:hypothetical protein